jgi:alanine racemase
MLTRAWAEVDLDALRHNVQAIREFIGPACAVMAIVKANGYGHGITQCAKAAVQAGASWLGVATVEEGVELRTLLPDTPICLITPFLVEDASTIVQHEITPFVSDLSSASALDEAARSLGRRTNAHLEVDTGMGRSGVTADGAGELAAALANLRNLQVTGLATHFASEEDPDSCERQLELFRDAEGEVHAAGLRPELLHSANSGALIRYPQSRMDLVRPGLLVYGIVPEHSPNVPRPEVRPVLTLRARVALIRELADGSSISYGGTHTLRRRSRVATLPIGYGDGYPRALSNKGSVIIRGRRAPILGRVCMDMMMIDVTDIPETFAGDEAVLIGRQGDENIGVEEIARLAETTEHDVTTRLTERVARVYLP